MTQLKERLYLLDLLKIMTLLAIAILHANEFIFYTDIFPLGQTSPVWHAMSYYARIFTLGGQVLVSLIYFLFGYAGKSRQSLARIALFALLGQSVLALVFGAFEWDIYVFITASNLLILLIPFFYRKNPILNFLSIFILSIPTHLFQNISNENPVWIILTGQQSSYNSGSWPLIPWFFLTLLNFQLGLLARDHKEKLRFLRKNELLIWAAFFILALPFSGAYYWVPIGPNYYHFVFNQWPWVYWSNILIFIFVMRVSFLQRIQEKLEESSIVQWISDLYWIRHLGAVYLLSIIYLGIGMRFSETFQNYPLTFDLFFIGILPISELTGRILFKAVKYFK